MKTLKKNVLIKTKSGWYSFHVDLTQGRSNFNEIKIILINFIYWPSWHSKNEKLLIRKAAFFI